MKARKKPVVIETVQWKGDNAVEIAKFLGEALFMDEEKKRLLIHTFEGNMVADIGDWVIKGVNGEFYPCKPDIFEKTYDIIEK